MDEVGVARIIGIAAGTFWIVIIGLHMLSGT